MHEQNVAEAIRRAIMVETVERRKSGAAKLGFSAVNYGNLFIRDYWTLFAIARELECSISDLTPPVERRSSTGLRWADLVDASEKVMHEVRLLPVQTKDLLVWRAGGHAWAIIQKRLPGRVGFSLREDYASGVAHIGKRCAEQVRLFSNAENFFVAKRAAAA